MPQIILEELCKSYTVYERPEGRFSILRGMAARRAKTIHALSDIGFSIDKGELVGYIGPNGAGKSTTIKIMSGILNPDSGRCEIMGRTPWKERVGHVSEIGVVFGQRSQLWWDVPVGDSFVMLKNIYHVPRQEYLQRLSELSEVLQIGDLLKTPARQLSLGQRMRCELAAALLHNPGILFLDEPTIGLDAVSKIALREFLRDANRRTGMTLLLTTHDMDDIEALCSRVMVIGKGRLLFDGSLETLKRTYAPLRILKAKLLPGSAVAEVEPIEGAAEMIRNENEWTIYFNPELTPAHVMVARAASALPLTDIVVMERDIDEIIALLYKELNL